MDRHNGVYVSPRAQLGAGVRLGSGVKIYGPARIGEGTWLDTGVVIGYPAAEEVAELRNASGACRDLDEAFDAITSNSTTLGARSFVRTGSVIYSGVEIGDQLDCAHHVVVREGCWLGSSVELGPFAYLKRDCRVGHYTRIATELCDRTYVGQHCSIYGRTSHKFLSGISGLVEDAPAVRDGVVVGRDAIVIGGIEIGELAYVAAGAVVTQTVGPETVVAGNPARFLRERKRDEAPDLWQRVRRREV